MGAFVLDIAFRLDNSFDKYITELKKIIKYANENTIKSRHFKKWYETGKAVLVWILVILAIFIFVMFIKAISSK